MSINSIDISTSAPPGNSREAISHKLQYRGFSAERCLRNRTRASIPPNPWKGVLQNLQRGSRGRVRITRRKLLSTAKAFVENQNHQTFPTSMGFLSFMIFDCAVRFAGPLYTSGQNHAPRLSHPSTLFPAPDLGMIVRNQT